MVFLSGHSPVHPMCIPCAYGDYVYCLEKAKLHSSHGLVSWERQQQIKSTLKAVLRF